MARAKKDMTGERRGDFLICRRVAERTYEVKCLRCGAEREFSTNSIRYGKMKCSRCENLGIQSEKKCKECGAEFIPLRNLQKFCSKKCCSTFHNRRKKHAAANENRKITRTTRMLVCIYAAEGLSVEKTAEFLRRPKKTISEILERCRENGEYKYFVNNSPILKARNLICT